jgi:hypothetical protein
LGKIPFSISCLIRAVYIAYQPISFGGKILKREKKKEDNVKEYGEMANDKGEIEVKRVKSMQKGQKKAKKGK